MAIIYLSKENFTLPKEQNLIMLKELSLALTLPKPYTVKPVLSGHSKVDKKLVFKTDYHLMQVKSIAESSKRAFCNTFDLH